MATKTYTLADGTTATVDADENGVPFNQAMDILSRAIRAAIDSGGESSETEPSGGESSETEPSGGSLGNIESFTVSQNSFEVAFGETYQETLTFDVVPSGITYSVSLNSDMDWITLSNNVIAITPPIGTTPGWYSATLVATSLNSKPVEISVVVTRPRSV